MMTANEIPSKHRLLLVDDEPAVLNSLARTLRRDYDVLTATSGGEALALLEQHEVAIIVTDQRMPQMTGTEFLAEARHRSPTTVSILLTGYSDIQAVIDAINLGQAFRYHAKPWNTVELQGSLAQAAARYDAEQARIHELERLNHHLTDEVTARTAEIRAQNIRLAELEKLKSRFLANISHQLRTPLTIVISSLDLIQRGRPEKRDLYLKNASESAHQLEKLIVDVLNFSMINRAEDQLTLTPAALNQVVGEVIRAKRPQAESRAQQLRWTPAAEEITAPLDDQLMRAAVDSVLNNAIEYTPTGGEVRVWIERLTLIAQSDPRATGPTGDFAAIYVSDSGPGIAEADRRHLFEPFFRGSNQDAGQMIGIGLGLSLAAGIMRWHNGRAELVRSDDTGSTFRLVLPTTASDTNATDPG